jgi:sulfofructose kinase
MATVLCVGHAVQDFVFTVAALPKAGGKFQASRFASVGGGPAATAAVAIVRLGGLALLAARVGGDAVAREIIGELEACGVDCAAVRRLPGCASSLSAVMVDAAGERMIVNYLDAAMPIAADWLPSPRAVGAAAVLADSRWPEGAARALAAARAAGLPGVLDADKPLPRADTLLAEATHVAFSAESLADSTGEDDPVRGLRATAGRLRGWGCVTAGAAGVYVLEGGRVTHFPGHAVQVVDTLGAGDVWHGAFALGLAEGMVEPAAVRFASAAAALKVQRPGGRAGAPTREEVEDFVRSAGIPAAREVE